MRKHYAVAAAAVAVAAAVAPAVPAAAASAPAPRPQHVVLDGGRYALDALGKSVIVAPYSPRNGAEDFTTSHAMGGQFNLSSAPGGQQTHRYVQVTVHGATLVNGPRQATLFTAGRPQPGGWYTLTATIGQGRHAVKELLTSSGRGKVTLAPAGRHGPDRDQLWKITVTR